MRQGYEEKEKLNYIDALMIEAKLHQLQSTCWDQAKSVLSLAESTDLRLGGTQDVIPNVMTGNETKHLITNNFEAERTALSFL